MKKLFNSVAHQRDVSDARLRKRDIAYEVDSGYEAKPCLHLAISTRLENGSVNDVILDISREDMVEILNDIVDEWPEIVDPPYMGVKQGVEVIPTFS